MMGWLLCRIGRHALTYYSRGRYALCERKDCYYVERF